MKPIALAITLLLVATPSWAQTRDENLVRCSVPYPAAKLDPDAKIAGCTALIGTGRETTANLTAELTNRAAAYIDKGFFDLALADANRAIAVDPANADAFVNRGDVYYKTARIDLAIADYSQAIALRPGIANAYNNRAKAYFKAGRREEAIADLRTVLKANPHDADALMGMKFLNATP